MKTKLYFSCFSPQPPFKEENKARVKFSTSGSCGCIFWFLTSPYQETEALQAQWKWCFVMICVLTSSSRLSCRTASLQLQTVCLKRVSAPKNPPRDQEEPSPGPGAIFLLPQRKSRLLSQVESSSLWRGKNMGRYFVGSTLNFPPLGK